MNGEIATPHNSIISFRELDDAIMAVVRTDAQRVGDFKHGTICRVYCPKSLAGRSYLGIPNKEMDIRLCSPIVRDGSMVLPANYWGTGQTEIDCHERARQQIADCIFAVKHGLGRRSSDCPPEDSEHGSIPGCVEFSIYREISHGFGENTDEHFLRIYVSVFGSPSSAANERCALTAKNILEQMRDVQNSRMHSPRWTLVSPE